MTRSSGDSMMRKDIESRINVSELDSFIQSCIKKEIFTDSQVGILYQNKKWAKGFGSASTTKQKVVFDIASLSKIVSTTYQVMDTVNRGIWSLDDLLPDLLTSCLFKVDFKNPNLEKLLKEKLYLKDKEAISVRHLLSHTSGFKWHHPFFEKGMNNYPIDNHWQDQRRRILLDVLSLPIESFPGQKRVYSDLGFMVLGILLELTFDQTLDQLFKSRVAVPLGMSNTFYLPQSPNIRPQSSKPSFPNTIEDSEFKNDYLYIKTEKCPDRQFLVEGAVHDLNCYVFGGVAGHAGLFANAQDLLLYADVIIKTFHHNKANIVGDPLDSDILQSFVDHKPYPLGFDTISGENPACGQYFSPKTIGHLGFTGTSLWVDLKKELAIVFLTNRVYPSCEDDRIKEIRPELHDIIMKQLIF